MKMMKKVISVALLGAMALSIAGCGKNYQVVSKITQQKMPQLLLISMNEFLQIIQMNTSIIQKLFLEIEMKSISMINEMIDSDYSSFELELKIDHTN